MIYIDIDIYRWNIVQNLNDNVKITIAILSRFKRVVLNMRVPRFYNYSQISDGLYAWNVTQFIKIFYRNTISISYNLRFKI